MRKKHKLPISQSSSCLRQAIMCGVAAIFCLLNIKSLWFFFLLFTAFCVFNIRYFVKYSEKEEEYEKKQKELYGDTESSDDNNTSPSKRVPSFIANHKALEQQRQARYDDFISNLESQLGDFDTEDDEDDEWE